MNKITRRELYDSGELKRRVEQAGSLLADCHLCPRRCGVNRLAGETGVCETGRYAQVSSFGAHFGEESPLVGQHGSGTIFLASCSLRCCFCQNYEISHFTSRSQERDAQALANLMLELEHQGCHNINLVTPSHVVPQILEAMLEATGLGLRIPLIYNSSGYDAIESLKLLEGVVDIYMPDFKFWLPESGKKYADAADYPEIARAAVKEMHRQVGDLQIDAGGLASRGLLLRHLLMPEGLAETEQIFMFIAQEISPNTYINIMDQYRPCGQSRHHAEISRPLLPEEYQQALKLAEQAGLSRLDERDFSTLLRHLGIGR